MTKNMKILLGVVVILIILFLINYMGQKKHTTQSENLFTCNPDDVFNIIIEEEGEKLEIVRIDTIWQIVGHDSLEIKRRQVDNFFTNVFTTKLQSIISRNPEKWAIYSVDDSTGTFLTLLNDTGDTLNRVIFGRSKSNYSRNYVRIGDDLNVYQTNSNVIHQLQTRPTYWGEKPKPPEPEEKVDTTPVE
ncbi:MAG: DUF4340 domain-containing protein [Candidatus Marinimicrobia bacterium]|nr:DUF4340 domain-containing protein [Candidatus Neomarinimicrobiota bacterium]